MKSILLCDSPHHADLVDQLVFARLQDVDGSHGNGWSGVLTDGTRFGILWPDRLVPAYDALLSSTPPADENPTA